MTNNSKEVNKKRGKAKKEAVKAATKVNLDADKTNEAAKPLTRSKSKTIVSQTLQENKMQQQDENIKLTNEQQSSDQIIAESLANRISQYRESRSSKIKIFVKL